MTNRRLGDFLGLLAYLFVVGAGLPVRQLWAAALVDDSTYKRSLVRQPRPSLTTRTVTRPQAAQGGSGRSGPFASRRQNTQR